MCPGDVLLSHAVTHAVPSALDGLTAVFGMGTGVAPPLLPPGKGRCEYGERTRRSALMYGNQIGDREYSVGYQAALPISTGKLHALPHFHLQPINLVIFEGSLGTEVRDISS